MPGLKLHCEVMRYETGDMVMVTIPTEMGTQLLMDSFYWCDFAPIVFDISD